MNDPELLKANYDLCRTNVNLSAKNRDVLQRHNINISKITRRLLDNYVRNEGLK